MDFKFKGLIYFDSKPIYSHILFPKMQLEMEKKKKIMIKLVKEI